MEQEKFEIVDSNIIKIGFILCKDCNENVICPHCEYRRGCRTKETVKELKI